MSQNTKATASIHNADHGNFRTYLIGYVVSIGLTLTAYFVVTSQAVNYNPTLYLIAGLALLQFWVQMVLFLHLGKETKPRWKLLVFSFMLMTVLILVFGSIWIMNNLDYHHIDKRKSSDTFIIKDEGYKP